MLSESISIRARHIKTLFERKGFVVADMVADRDFGPDKPLRYIFKNLFKPLVVDATYVLAGKIVSHEQHGLQFEVSSTDIQPEPALITALLNGEVPSIGKETGMRIYELLGNEVMTLSAPEPFMQLSGIGRKKALSILANINQFKESHK